MSELSTSAPPPPPTMMTTTMTTTTSSSSNTIVPRAIVRGRDPIWDQLHCTVATRSVREICKKFKRLFFVIPQYQRVYCWTDQIKQEWLDSVFNLPSGLVMPVTTNVRTDPDDGVKFEDIVDGRHRLETLYAFKSDEFVWKTRDGQSLRYSDLTEAEKQRFLDFEIRFTVLQDWNDSAVRKCFTKVHTLSHTHTPTSTRMTSNIFFNFCRSIPSCHWHRWIN